MILFAPHRGQFPTSSDILLWLDVDFQVEMYFAKSSQVYMAIIEIQRRIGFHDLKAFINRFQFRCNVDWSTWYPFSMTEDPRPLTQDPPF